MCFGVHHAFRGDAFRSARLPRSIPEFLSAANATDGGLSLPRSSIHPARGAQKTRKRRTTFGAESSIGFAQSEPLVVTTFSIEPTRSRLNSRLKEYVQCCVKP